MDSIIIKKFALSELFSSERGNSKLTKAYCNKHKGKYEVYTGSTKTSFAFIDTFAYSKPLLTYTTDGEYAGILNLQKHIVINIKESMRYIQVLLKLHLLLLTHLPIQNHY